MELQQANTELINRVLELEQKVKWLKHEGAVGADAEHWLVSGRAEISAGDDNI